MHHGWAKSLKWWTPCVARVAGRYPIVRYDVRGCGNSAIPGPEIPWTVERFVTDAVNILDGLGIDRVHWVGFESGGAYGLAFAAWHPDRVSSVTTVNTANSTWNRDGNMNSFFSLGHATVEAAIQDLGLDHWLSKTIAIHVDLSLADDALIRWVHAEILKTPLHVAKEWVDVYAAMDTSAIAEDVKAPTLLMAGANHGYGCDPVQLGMLANLISNCRVKHLPNVGAGIQLIAPDACASTLLSFIEDLS
jgi:3-oxoadipate enol-lactonase